MVPGTLLLNSDRTTGISRLLRSRRRGAKIYFIIGFSTATGLYRAHFLSSVQYENGKRGSHNNIHGTLLYFLCVSAPWRENNYLSATFSGEMGGFGSGILVNWLLGSLLFRP